MNYLFLAVIFFLGTLIVWKDIHSKKISNKLIIIGLILGFFLITLGSASGYLSLDYVEKIIINTLLSFVAAVLIWQMGFWPAGDAKFFIFLTLLLPLSYYERSYLVFFPAFALLFNIFVSFFIFAILKSGLYILRDVFFLLKTKESLGETLSKRFKKWQKEILEKARDKKNIARFILKIITQLIFGLIFYLIVSRAILGNRISWISAIAFMVIFKIMLACINSYMKRNSCEKIKTCDLKIGDNLDNVAFAKLNRNDDTMKKIGKLNPEGLNFFQVTALKEHFVKNNINEITVYKTIPFSTWMLIGTMLTVIFRGMMRINFW